MKTLTNTTRPGKNIGETFDNAGSLCVPVIQIYQVKHHLEFDQLVLHSLKIMKIIERFH